MHRLTEKLTALEYAVAFLLEREERKLMAKTTHTQEDLQDSARLEDLRAELQLHMTEKPEPVDIMCPLCRKVELVPEVPIIGLNPSAEELAQNEFYQCPCGEDHNDPDTPGDEDVAP